MELIPEQQRVHSEQNGADSNNLYKGIGGWLIYFAIVLIYGVIYDIANIAFVQIPYFTNGTLKDITTQGNKYFSPYWYHLSLFEISFSGFSLLFGLAILVLFFKKKRSLPNCMIAMFLLTFIYMELDTLIRLIIQQSLTYKTDITYFEIIVQLIANLTKGTIFIAYFIKSERVKNTFVN